MEDAFKHFDALKLKEIVTYINECKNYPVKIQTLRRRIELVGAHLVKQNMGSAPFKFGYQKDYWPMIPKSLLTDFQTKYSDIVIKDTLLEKNRKNFSVHID